MKVLKVTGVVFAIVLIIQIFNVILSEPSDIVVSEERQKELDEFNNYRKRAEDGPSIEDPNHITFQSKYDSVKVYNANEFTTDGNNKTTFIMSGTTFIRSITVLVDETPVKTYHFKGCAVQYKAVAANRRDWVQDEGYREFIPELHDLQYKERLIKWFSNTNNCLYGEKYMAKYVKNSSEIMVHLGLIK